MTYDGGKNGAGVWQLLINQMPPHRVYVEAFLGSGAVMRRKRPAAVNVGIERDAAALETFRANFTGCDLVHGSALEWLEGYPGCEDVFIYADPPYLMETRSCQRDLYACEFGTEAEHRALLALLDSKPWRVMLSGYWSEIYNATLRAPKWRRVEFVAGSRRGPRVECLWMNFPPPTVLHDYRFLGRDRTDRQRIARKVANWRAQLLALPPLERRAILAGIDRL